MSKVHAVRGQAPAVREPIAADRVRAGAPVTEARLDFQRGERVFAGEWSADVGAWAVTYDEWEFCHMLDGVCELVDTDGGVQRFAQGDSFVIEPGFVGEWRVLAPMRKRFVVWYD